MIKKRKIVFFTGSGISQESNIPTFRDSTDGLWLNYPVEDVTVDGVFKNIDRSSNFFNSLKKHILTCSPNLAHKSIAELSLNPKLDIYIITQNIDNLHQKSGFPDNKIYELHGNIFYDVCRSHPNIKDTQYQEEKGCYYRTEYYEHDFVFPKSCPKCSSLATLSPSTTLFGESLDGLTLSHSIYHAESADLIIQVGASLDVFPANNIIFQADKDKLIYTDIKTPNLDYNVEYKYEFIGKASEKVSEICRLIKSNEI